MKTTTLSLLALAVAGAFVSLPAQLAVPPAPPPNAELPPVISAEAPLLSLESQLGPAVFDQRGAFASAYDEANRLVDVQVAQLRARGLVFAEEASANLSAARDEARQVFRDLSLTTEESWTTARHNAMNALRKVQLALLDLEKTATTPQTE
jgi:hypothetical protein